MPSPFGLENKGRHHHRSSRGIGRALARVLRLARRQRSDIEPQGRSLRGGRRRSREGGEADPSSLQHLAQDPSRSADRER